MEPLGAVAAVFSLVKATREIARRLRVHSNAPEHIRRLQLDVDSFQIVIDGFERVIQDPWVVARIPTEQTKSALAEACETLHSLEKLLASIPSNNGDFVSRFLFVLKEPTCHEYSRRIEKQGNVLSHIMAVAEHIVLERRHIQVLQHLGPAAQLVAAQSLLALEEDSSLAQLRDPLDNTTVSRSLSCGTVCAWPESENLEEIDVPAIEPALRGERHDTVVFSKNSAELFALGPAAANTQTHHRPNSVLIGSRSHQFGVGNEVIASGRLVGTGTREPDVLPRNSKDNRDSKRRRSRSSNFQSTSLGRSIFSVLQSRMVIPPTYHRVVPETCDSMILASHGRVPEMRLLFNSGLANVNDRGNSNWSLLMTSAWYGSREMIVFLLQNKADTEAEEDFGRKAVHFALTRAYNLNATQIDILRCKAFPRWQDSKDDFEFTPIHLAVLEGYPLGDKERPGLQEMINFSDKLHQHRNQVPPGPTWAQLKKEYKNRSPLYVHMIDLFRAADAEYQKLEAKQPKSPQKNYAEMRKGSDTSVRSMERTFYFDILNQPDAVQGWTPFEWATNGGRLEGMKILLDNGANPFVINKMKRSCLHRAAESANDQIIDFLFQIKPARDGTWFDVNLQDHWGETPLTIAVYRQSLSIVKKLIGIGARSDLCTMGNSTSVHEAAILPTGPIQLEIMRCILDTESCNVNIQDDNKRTALFLCLNNPDVVRLLLDNGTNLELLDFARNSVFHYACRDNNMETLSILISHLKSPSKLPQQENKEGSCPLSSAIAAKSFPAATLMLQHYGAGTLAYKDGRSLVHRAIEAADPNFLEVCFKDHSFKQGVRTYEGWNCKELASRCGLFEGEIKKLILKYESYHHSGGDEGDSDLKLPSLSQAIRAQSSEYGL